MVKQPVPELALRLLWLSIGYMLVALVIYLSLTSDPVNLDIDIRYQDKFFHALAYFTLMFWFAQIYHDRFQRYGYAISFILMGVVLEYLQSFNPDRYYEFADMLANATGVILGFLLALTSAKNILFKIDDRLKGAIN
ncbi:MAG TPA: VanZ family protein [Gammaproteobacteria bacterium]|nr:VanZ family protein [Gammaproteobacteria bacterium]